MPELNELETALRGLAADLDWPPTPGLAAAVMRRLEAPLSQPSQPSRPQLRWFERRWAMAAVALILAIAVLLAYTPTRTAIADWLNLHVRISRPSVLPTPSPLPSGPLGTRLGLGRPTSLESARGGVPWAVFVPGTLGAPDEVYLQNPPIAPSQGEVTLVYAMRPGIPVAGTTGVSVLVTEARGTVDEQFFGKMIGTGSTIEVVSVGGHRGWWISGALHEFFFIDAAGNQVNETMRLATNTLILDDGGTIVRIEGDLTKQQALAVAASLS